MKRPKDICSLAVLLWLASSCLACLVVRILWSGALSFWLICLCIISLILGIHTFFALRLWNRYAYPRSLLALAALALLTSVFWSLVAAILMLSLALAPNAAVAIGAEEIILKTLALPMTLFNGLEPQSTLPRLLGKGSYSIYSLLLTASGLFLFGTLASLACSRHSQNIIERSQKTSTHLNPQ